VSLLSVPGFTNLGYKLHSRDYEDDLGDMTGKTVLVTGATGGLGLAAATGLSELGAEVVIVGRDQAKIDAALSESGAAHGYRSDLSLLAEVRDLASDITREHSRLDVLINNVGVLYPEKRETDEGLEASLATNLAGQFLLTNILLPLLQGSTPSRVITVTSGGMYTARLSNAYLLEGKGDYKGATMYAQTKRAQVILTEMWAEKLTDSGVVFHVMHPGWAKTAGVKTSLPTFNKLMYPFLRTPEQGADTIIWLASAERPAESSGGFWFDREPAPTHLLDRTVEKDASRDRLWAGLVGLTGSDLTHQES
jgi:dehydrogenase/reductase SDR family member 12